MLRAMMQNVPGMLAADSPEFPYRWEDYSGPSGIDRSAENMLGKTPIDRNCHEHEAEGTSRLLFHC